MPDRSLLESYSQAIVSSAVDKWVSGLEIFRNGLQTDDEARGMLSDGSLPVDERRAVARRLCGPDSQVELVNLAQLLAERGHLGLLDDLIATLRRVSRYGPEAVLALVTSAIPLDEATKGDIVRRLTARYGSSVAVEWRVDSAIIGGLVIQVGDELTDDSVATRLERLRNTLHGRG